ncbi:MAG: hypothetical protein ACUVUC_16015 [Thermoguttaceae bacterium]
MRLIAWSLWIFALGTAACNAAGAQGQESSSSPEPIPAGWLQAWDNPPLADRPLQIVHAVDPQGRILEAIRRNGPGQQALAIAAASMKEYLDHGLGGIVCNVAFHDYLQSEENWKTLAAAVEACRRLGMVVWLYDEEGYPSGAAGGLVLKENPQFEAQALALDPARPDPFLLRPSYEHTHASNNYHAARRYINLLDDRAVRSFIAKTHEAYFQRLGPYFGSTIQAVFTDEPSLMAINLGQLPEAVRSKVRVVDPLDPGVRPLPSVPWGYDLADRYRQRYGEDLVAQRRSLFAGDSPADRKVRRQYWALIAELVAQRYFGAIQTWCAAHKIASSGHTLWEEDLMHHPALEGNALKVLCLMDIPGLDMLTSNPEAVIHSGWMTAGLPSSAAMLAGRRRVMTEVSDFAEKMGGRGPASLADMQAAAAWQAAWGVTEFTLYYQIADRPAEQYRAYCQYVGRLNTILKPARLQADVLLYYPVWDLWAEYVPVAEPLRLASQSPRAQRIVQSFNRLGQTLQRRQIPFCLIDHERLAAAEPAPDGTLGVGDRRFRLLVLPADVELPREAAAVVTRFQQRGGRVLLDDPPGRLASEAIVEAAQSPTGLSPPSPQIALGRFTRDQRTILLLVNVGRQAYQGRLAVRTSGTWVRLDPVSGARLPAAPEAGQLALCLAPCQAVLLVHSP